MVAGPQIRIKEAKGKIMAQFERKEGINRMDRMNRIKKER
jgi:hypothetical protein